MTWFKMLFAGVFALLATSVQAQTWRHAQSGISLEIPQGLSAGDTTDSRNDGSDVIVQLGSDETIVTFYVYRAAYPNAALWYDRARAALSYNFSLTDTPNPRSFTLAGASQPNGLREELDVRGRHMRAAPQLRMNATAIAMASHGDWLIKVRISARELDRAGVTRLMDSVLGGVRLSGAMQRNLPLTVPDACPANLTFNGQIANRAGSGDAARSAQQAVEASARGRSGLAVEPAAWCRLQTSLPAPVVSVFARRDGGGWVALLSDAGAAITAVGGGSGAAGGATLHGSTPSGNRLLFSYDGVPPPAAAVERGFRPTMAIQGNDS